MPGRFLRTLEIAGAAIAASALFSMTALTFVDVLSRKFFFGAFRGSLEITELLMVIVIFGALPAVSANSEHVNFDSLDGILSKKFLSMIERFANLSLSLVHFCLAWFLFQMALQFMKAGEVTAQLNIPKYPFIFAMSVSTFVCGLIHGTLTMRRRARR